MHLARSLCLLAACVLPVLAFAQKQTVCTITINSADEKESFRRFLPADKYQFVELVERKRKDWLASSCEAKVSCDVLVISGHHGEGNVFFSDSLEKDEFLPIEELERVSCSGSCPSLFANLKEVYLFGCNTMNTQAQHTISGEVARSYVREGRSADDAARLARVLGQQRGESSRDRMRLLFKDVPVIYGFSGVAPLGSVAGPILNRYFQNAGTSEIGKGRTSASLLRQFSSHGMVAGRGIGDGDPLMPLRQDVCKFADDRLSPAQRLASIHGMVQRPTAESRLLLERIEGATEAITPAEREEPEVKQALERIAADTETRDRYLAFARDADQPLTRARMIDVAHELRWLSAEQRRGEIVKMVGDVLARKDVGVPDVDLACTLNKKGDLDGTLANVAAQVGRTDNVANSAVLACMGEPDARPRVLERLASPSDADVRIAQAYLRHRPIAEKELPVITKAIAGMNAPEAQARALDVLARHYLSDRESVDTLRQLFERTRSVPVQNAIAGVLIRADRKSVRSPELLRTLRENRVKTSPGDNMVDALIQRLQESS
jgi:hypothetical protein